MKLNEVDIVIVNYKSTSLLIKCIDSVCKTLGGIKARIFVEDNGSDDDVKRITTLFPKVVLTENGANLGFAKAVNRGIRKGQAPYILLLNPDSLVLDGFFETIFRFMEQNPAVGILGPRILNADLSIQGSARSFPTPLTAFFGRRSLLTRFFPENKLTRQNLLTIDSDGESPMAVDWVSGACIVARRKAVEDVGLLDERFFMYWEDADWCRRMSQAGWEVVYFPGASIIHYVGVSSRHARDRSIFEFHKSSYRLFEKYSERWIGVFKPLIISVLAIRIVAVLGLNKILELLKTNRPTTTSRREIEVPRKGCKIKVLRMISRVNIGGPAIHVSLLSDGLNKDIFESILVAGTIPSQEGDMSYFLNKHNIDLKNIPEMQREISLLNDVIAMIRIIKLFFKERPDIVHTHTSKAGTIGRIGAFLYNFVSTNKALTVHTFHGHVFEGYFGPIKSQFFVLVERLLACKTNAIIAISNSQRQELSIRYRIAPPSKIKAIPLGFDLAPFFSARNRRGGFREKIGMDDTNFLVGIVGRLAPIKDHFMFFLAAKKFIEEHPGNLIRFVVVGDGELRGRLVTFCRERGLDEFVHFSGWQRDIVTVYADLDILALTSANEGTPVSIIEAMASSVPVIATDVGGVRDLLGQQCRRDSGGFTICERGILCKRGDALGLANGMRYIWKEGLVERHKRLVDGRNFVAQQFSKDRLLEDVEGLYLELVNRKKLGLFEVVESKRLSHSAPLRIMR